MVLTLPIIIQILVFAGSLIGIYIRLNNKIIRLESTQENHTKQITKLEQVYTEDLKEIKAMLHELDKKITQIEAVQKLRDNEHK